MFDDLPSARLLMAAVAAVAQETRADLGIGTPAVMALQEFVEVYTKLLYTEEYIMACIPWCGYGWQHIDCPKHHSTCHEVVG